MIIGKILKKYLDDAIKISDDEPSLYQPEFNEEVVSEIMDTQKTIIEHIKKIIIQINYSLY